MKAGDLFEGSYRLVRELGRGGHATVWLGEHVEIGQLVAIKLMHIESARFTREGRVLARLTCRHSVRLLAFGRTDDGEQYLISEWIDGETLTQFMARECPLHWKPAVDIVRQVLLSLEEAHGIDVVHRDVKPSNVMVSGDNTIKLLDFGIVRFEREATLANIGELVGTPRYIAPEVVRGEEAQATADVFAVGLIIYALLTASHANDLADAEGILRRHLDSEPYALPGDLRVPQAIREWVDSLIQKDPKRRPVDAGEALRALDLAEKGGGFEVEATDLQAASSEDATGPVSLAHTRQVLSSQAAHTARGLAILPVPAPTEPEPSAPRSKLFGAWTVILLVVGSTVAAYQLGGFASEVTPDAADDSRSDAGVEADADASAPDAKPEPSPILDASEQNPQLIAKRGIDHYEHRRWTNALRDFHHVEQQSDARAKILLERGSYRRLTIEQIVAEASAAAVTATSKEEIEEARKAVLSAQSLYRANPSIKGATEQLREAGKKIEKEVARQKKRKRRKR